ncbi:hypothetical protein GIB67_018897 [Kingdonia uniflora]|uniref:GDSL esterase/lipase n=1 Tax=Kingdonia uniflora TaxID=39325 RepID=A0A7J7MZ40_9MAGN|nr:hypothetical protein GIB67_018897 [Kingdonia uniflora]
MESLRSDLSTPTQARGTLVKILRPTLWGLAESLGITFGSSRFLSESSFSFGKLSRTEFLLCTIYGMAARIGILTAPDAALRRRPLLTRFSSVQSSQVSDCEKRLQRALVFVGEIGGNDYNYAFFQGKQVEEISNYVPHVVRSITDAVQEVIRKGAIRVVVSGNFPVGCIPIYIFDVISQQ